VKATVLGLLTMLAGGCRERAGAAAGHDAQGNAASSPGGNAASDGAEWSCGAVHGEARMTRRLGRAGRLRLGAVADLRGNAGEAARAAQLFGREAVDGVLALGDLGDDEDGVTQVLEALGTAGAPLLALAGEAEAEGAFHAAVRRARARGIDVIDLVDVRVVDAGEALIVAAPGYRYGKNGCRYRPRDLEPLRALVGRPGKPLLLAAHAPPRDDGPDGIDRGFGDANIGDPAMRALVDEMEPAAALFAHLDEAGGRQHGRWLNVGQRRARVDVAGGRATMTVLP
jgi:hypothetical protein